MQRRDFIRMAGVAAATAGATQQTALALGKNEKPAETTPQTGEEAPRPKIGPLGHHATGVPYPFIV